MDYKSLAMQSTHMYATASESLHKSISDKNEAVEEYLRIIPENPHLILQQKPSTLMGQTMAIMSQMEAKKKHWDAYQSATVTGMLVNLHQANNTMNQYIDAGKTDLYVADYKVRQYCDGTTQEMNGINQGIGAFKRDVSALAERYAPPKPKPSDR